MNYKSLLASKTARFFAGGLVATLGFALMYPAKFGLHIEITPIIGGISMDMVGGMVFAAGIFLIANGMRAD